MQQVLDENALPHVAAHVEAEAGEVPATQTDHADPGGLGLQEHRERDVRRLLQVLSGENLTPVARRVRANRRVR